jgi:octaprenyl-diphosphate synthase
MAAYGMHLGTAFQVIDDVLDYSGDYHDTGKNVGDDLAEGKPTLPLIFAMQHAQPEQATLVRHAIEQGGLTDLQGVVQAIRTSGALDYARNRAQEEADTAIAAITALPRSVYKDSLLQLASFAVARTY